MTYYLHQTSFPKCNNCTFTMLDNTQDNIQVKLTLKINNKIRKFKPITLTKGFILLKPVKVKSQ